jgi:hypothetical protein
MLVEPAATTSPEGSTATARASLAGLKSVVSSPHHRPILNFLFAGLGSLPPGPTARTLNVYRPGFRCL